MATLAEWEAQNNIGSSNSRSSGEDFNFGDEDTGWLGSMAAGVPSGIFKIFEGVATLGATLLDLGVDKDRAESVEAFFDKINPFDEAASATAAGKITELIINLGVPGAPAFKIGSGLAKATLKAKEAGTYLTGMEKARRLGQGSLATGVTDAIFVGDVENAGTFGDFMGGPTELDRDTDTPGSELLNRLKFGTEGVAFAGAISGIGQGISKLRNETGTGKVVEGKVNKFFELVSGGLRAKGNKNWNQFIIENTKRGRIDKDVNIVERFRDTIDDTTLELARKYNKTAGSKIGVLKTQQNMLEEMQDVLVSGSGKDGKMIPIFSEVAEISTDPTTGYAFRNGKGVLKDMSPDMPLPKKVKIKDPKTGEIRFENTKEINPNTGKIRTVQEVTIDAVDPIKKKAFEDKLIKTYKASPKQVEDLFNTITRGREKFGELFTGIGKRLTPESWGEFQTILKGSLNDVVDRGYGVFRNNSGQLGGVANYAPVNTLLKKTVNYYKKVAKQKGYQVTDGPTIKVKEIDPATGKQIEVTKLGDDLFEKAVRDTWEGATMDKGFITASGVTPGTVKLASLPKFFTDSVLDNLANAKLPYIAKNVSNLSEVTGMDKKIIQRLLGKNKNPMSTLVEGVSNLSAQVRSGQAFDEMVIKNNKLKVAWDKWNNGFKQMDPKTKQETIIPPRTGVEPEVPFLFDNRGIAQKIAGGGARDFTSIAAPQSDAARVIDRFVDTNLSLKGVDDIEQARINKIENESLRKITNPLAGKYALNDVADTFMKTEESSKNLGWQIYNNLVLYPKGTSQMAKTILAPFTHVRNFVSATAFAGANGILPFGNTKDVKAAWTALQAAGPGMRGSNEFYQELLELGVVNSSVRLRQVQDLLQDANFGSILNNVNSDYNISKLIKRFSKIKKGAEDFYAAEDDFWKIFTFLGEKSRIKNAYTKSGLSLGQEFTDMNGVKRLFNDRTLNELSADLVRNNVPNYSYVSDFIKGLRKFPLGNFVAFPAEIMRTGVNIVDTALKEINYSVIINGETVKPLAGRGRQRLMGMAITTAALPLGTIAAAETIYDITKDETAAMRRYVADWSKNSVLIPFKKEDGTLQYVDFSHLNAYDTLTRPIQTVLNKVEQGRADEDGIMDDFVLGLVESTKELLSPFVSESIWTEALQDVAPILGRGGTDSQGRRIWNPQDSIGDKMMKSVGHLVESQAPLNWKQLTRLGISMFPEDSKFASDERGNQYEFGNEAAGIFGMRRIDVDPKKSFNYKVTDYKKGVRNSRNLFTAATLKGGNISPSEIVDAYINANRALYNVNRELYQDIDAAKTLGMSTDAIAERMDGRGEGRAFDSLIEGEFRPLSISKDLQEIFEIKASELGVSNPFERAEGVIDSIAEQLARASLRGDLFPEIENPLDTSLIEGISGIIDNISLPDFSNIADLAPGFTGQGQTNVGSTGTLNFDQLKTQDQKLQRISNVNSLLDN